jgi:hypothetical protein
MRSFGRELAVDPASGLPSRLYLLHVISSATQANGKMILILFSWCQQRSHQCLNPNKEAGCWGVWRGMLMVANVYDIAVGMI